MKKMIIFDPAMCCSTGVCGPGVDPELLRVSTVLSNLKRNGVHVERYNLSHNPEAFVHNQMINQLLNQQGVGILPVTVLDDQIITTGKYLSNQEFCQYLGIPEGYLSTPVKTATVQKASKGCNCKGGCC